jgi:hypothetical protein
MSNSDSPQTDFRIPVVRHFIACEKVEKSNDGTLRSLINLIDVIEFAPGKSWPHILPQLCLFARLTDGRGKHSFQIQMVSYPDAESTRTTKSVMMDFEDDPLEIRRCVFRLNNVEFRGPGLYEFRLMCNGREIARESILLREEP